MGATLFYIIAAAGLGVLAALYEWIAAGLGVIDPWDFC